MSTEKELTEEERLKEEERFVYFDHLDTFFNPLDPYPVEGILGKEGLTAKAMAVSMDIGVSNINARMQNIKFRAAFDKMKKDKNFFAEMYKNPSGKGDGWMFDRAGALAFLEKCNTLSDSNVRYKAWLEDPNTPIKLKAKAEEEYRKRFPDIPPVAEAKPEPVTTSEDVLTARITSLEGVVQSILSILGDMPLTCSQRKEFSHVYLERCKRLAAHPKLGIPSTKYDSVKPRLLKYVKTKAECCWDGDSWKDTPQCKYKAALEAARTFVPSEADIEAIQRHAGVRPTVPASSAGIFSQENQ